MRTKMYEQLIDLYPLFRESLEGGRKTEVMEVNFVDRIFKTSDGKIKTVVDLGGGIGVHAEHLVKKGYQVSVFDRSKKVLDRLKSGHPNIETYCGRFENINLNKRFDAAICMWSTFSYILGEGGRKNFFEWISKHVRHAVILDEASFYEYLKQGEFHKIYPAVENEDFKLVVTRDWIISTSGLRRTSYVYTVTDKKTGKKKIIQDGEVQQYLSVDEIKGYMGEGWKLGRVFGGYDLKQDFGKRKSSRVISFFVRQT